MELHEQREYGNCGNCGRYLWLQFVELKDASGVSEYCKDCIINNPHVTITK